MATYSYCLYQSLVIFHFFQVVDVHVYEVFNPFSFLILYFRNPTEHIEYVMEWHHCCHCYFICLSSLIPHPGFVRVPLRKTDFITGSFITGNFCSRIN